ncbi:MAG: FAD-dependent thymidylate synthase [Christensenellaceae bacterium]|jgi:thymidylate synthase (FAD)|nr:FAD-dependent thymidylate synthase [Christensenellaceae bacterium]
MPRARFKLELIAHTPEPEKWIALAARTCYSAADIAGLRRASEKNDNAAYIRGIMASGHQSVIEHASFSFAVEGVSRALLAQITRHRVASFSVQSQRYVDFSQKGFDYVLPPRIEALGSEAIGRFGAQMQKMQEWYGEWAALLGENSAEDARFVLPQAAATRITMTMNARELLHFFSLRCCFRAQWEINALAWAMLDLVAPLAPTVFENAGPGCLRGPCPEGARSCGRAEEVREKAAKRRGFDAAK